QDHAAAVRWCLDSLTAKKVLASANDLGGIGFKAVHAQDMTGVQRVDDPLLAAMEAFGDGAPAPKPPYVAAMRLPAQPLPEMPLVAALETGFHETIPTGERLYAIPREWIEKFGIKKWGFHGASHRYIARGRPRCSAIRRRRSSRATSAVRVRSVRSRPGSRR